jgi:DNA mismatch repair protein MutS
MTKSVRITPMLEQYLAVKRQHKDKLVLFRMGDFYETFFDDAVEISRLLSIQLTSRNHGKGDKVPLAGIPHHALKGYADRITKAGRSFVIVEQVEDPKQAKGLVKRAVTEVVTPGTTLSESVLDAKRNNFLTGISVNGDRAGIAEADLSTGEFRVTEVEERSLFTELRRAGPAEVLAPRTWAMENRQRFDREAPGVALTPMEDWAFGVDAAREKLLEHFKVQSLKGFGADNLTAGVSAAGAVLGYLQDNQMSDLSHMRRLSVIENSRYLTLDEATQRNLELFEPISGDSRACLISVIDDTNTPMGGRLLRAWLGRPLKTVERIVERSDAVAAFVEGSLERDEARSVLESVYDIERLTAKICTARATPREVVGLAGSIEAATPLPDTLKELDAAYIHEAIGEMSGVGDVAAFIRSKLLDEPSAQVYDGNIIREGVSDELDELRDIHHGGRQWIAKMQSTERERTGIPSLKIGYNRAFGYYIEISNTHRDSVPEEYERKQTLVNAERYITPELKEWEAKVLTAEEQSQSLEYEMFVEVRDQVARRVEDLLRLAHAVAKIDVVAGLGELAARGNYCRPKITTDDVLNITDGRHPVVERLIPEGTFVPNDASIDNDTEQILVITGPNMAGKSTYLRQVGLLVIMAQMGSWIPAAKATVGIVDRVFTRVGAHDNLAGGESTFLVEMHETANILNNATPKSLVLFDEVGRGTSTFDGLSLAWAIIEYLHGTPHRAAKTMFATHYHELVELEELLPRVKNYNVAVREWQDEVIFLRKIQRGGCDHSYGIHVAQMAGLPSPVVRRAREVLTTLESKEEDTKRELGGADYEREEDREQVSLFQPAAPQEHPVVAELRETDLMNLSPLELMRRVDEWQKRLRGEGDNDGGYDTSS